MDTFTAPTLLKCKACGFLRICDDYSSAHARGTAHTVCTGHHNVSYEPIYAPERSRLAEQETSYDHK